MRKRGIAAFNCDAIFYSHAKIIPQVLGLRFASFVDPLFFHPHLCFSFLGSVFFSQGSKGGGKERRNPRRRQTDSKTAAAAAAAVQAAFLVSRQGKNSLFRISPSWTENGNREFPANLWEKSANVGFPPLLLFFAGEARAGQERGGG